MRFKLHYAWWTHLPSAACIAINMGFLLNAQLPARVPVEFTDGLPDRWGSPHELWLTMLGWPLLILIGSAVLDEYYARHEQERRFAWASLVDELLIGVIVGRNVKIMPQLSNPEPVLSGWWPLALVFAGGAVALAVLLELRRPHLPSVDKVVNVGALAKNIQLQFQPGWRWMYWEKQDPLWWRCMTILMTIVMALIAREEMQKSDWLGFGIAVLVAAILVAGYDGFHVVLTPGIFAVRLGRFGLPLLRLKLANVAKAEVVWFSALGDFGGWGFYRYSLSQRAWGLFLSGGRGVIVQTKTGRRFLIGSSTPEKLAAATEAARISATFKPDDVKGFVAAVQGIIPSQNTLRSDSDSASTQSSRSGRLRRGLARVAICILVISPITILFFFYSPGPAKYTVTPQELTIHDRFFPGTVRAAEVNIEGIRIVDVGKDPHWRLTQRSNGIGLLHYHAGWFRVAGGEKVRMYRADSKRLVLIPPQDGGTPVLLDIKQPEAFIQELRQAWR